MGTRSQHYGALVYLDERRAEKETQRSMMIHIAGGSVMGVEMPSEPGLPEKAFVIYHHPEPEIANAHLRVRDGDDERQAVRAVEVPLYECTSALAL